jgi:hypothetical protein
VLAILLTSVSLFGAACGVGMRMIWMRRKRRMELEVELRRVAAWAAWAAAQAADAQPGALSEATRKIALLQQYALAAGEVQTPQHKQLPGAKRWLWS